MIIITPGLVLGPVGYRLEFGIGGTETERKRVVMEQVGEVGGDQVMEGFVSEEENLNLLWDR